MTILTTPEVLRIAADNIEAGRAIHDGIQMRKIKPAVPLREWFTPTSLTLALYEECWEYRRKPKTITYTVTHPEPLRVAPKDGAQVWTFGPSGDVIEIIWTREDSLLAALIRGNLFAAKEDAEAADKARLEAYQGVSK